MTDNVITDFEQRKVMREFSSNMRGFLKTVEEANQTFLAEGDGGLLEATNRLRETVEVIEETERMLIAFGKGEITLEELEAFRDQVAALRS